ncbi:DUF541 domain-containing protein [Duganella sp. FT50W]|uniref:DUF541 domain-containing protein n=1 Tax=Duganella lactea TaxID=2692173 RepID=A0A6L8MSA2_9BURK|nr:SIMPL domain-containing protein [Duganella lactea]MYM84896.1 DUF541 domain-containing protein [Duganella lactea]
MLRKIALACAFALGVLNAEAGDLPSYPFIHTGGSASLNVQPDIGEIDLELLSSEQDLNAAWTTVTTRLADIRALLNQQGMAETELVSQSISRTARKADASGVVQLDTRCALHVVVRDLSKWPALVNGLLQLPNVSDFAVSFSRSDREQIETQLVAEAVADARHKAATIGKGMGQQVGAVRGIALSPLKNLSNAFGLATADGYRGNTGRSGAGDNPTLIASIKMVQSVDVLFAIK